MSFFINAWLERQNPRLELRESTTNCMIYCAEGKLLNELLNKGEITIADLNNYENTQNVIEVLLLKSIIEPINMFKNKDLNLMNVIKLPKIKKRIREKKNINQPQNSKVIFLSADSGR